MHFSASDDFGTQDWFSWGSGDPRSSFQEGMRVYTNGKPYIGPIITSGAGVILRPDGTATFTGNVLVNDLATSTITSLNAFYTNFNNYVTSNNAALAAETLARQNADASLLSSINAIQANYVTTNTAQTITASKVFTGAVQIGTALNMINPTTSALNKIVNLANGTNNTDAVNLSQLTALQTQMTNNLVASQNIRMGYTTLAGKKIYNKLMPESYITVSKGWVENITHPTTLKYPVDVAVKITVSAIVNSDSGNDDYFYIGIFSDVQLDDARLSSNLSGGNLYIYAIATSHSVSNGAVYFTNLQTSSSGGTHVLDHYGAERFLLLSYTLTTECIVHIPANTAVNFGAVLAYNSGGNGGQLGKDFNNQSCFSGSITVLPNNITY